MDKYVSPDGEINDYFNTDQGRGIVTKTCPYAYLYIMTRIF